jgi:hypothetical protein
MLIIPLSSVPSQAVTSLLSGQLTQINVRQKAYGLHLDLYVSNVLLLAGAVCQDRNLIVRSRYIGFVGDLSFVDTRGSDDPTYEGLGDRFFLVYLNAGEILSDGIP